MVFRSILTVMSDAKSLSKGGAKELESVATIALAEDAHLDVLGLAVDRVTMGYSYIGAGIEALQIAHKQLNESAKELDDQLTAEIGKHPFGLRSSVETAIVQIGAITDLVAQRARYADLVVLPQPYGKGRGNESEMILEAALFEGQAPVLVLPEGNVAALPPRRAVIAWNGSRESLNAVRAALPLLKTAERVIITMVDPSPKGVDRSDPGGLLCQMLVRHGVKAEVAVLARSLPRISDVLAQQLRDVDADLLVMGAYGHSRFRESILGGATRHMLETAQVPVLMAH